MMELDIGDATQVYIAFLVYLDLMESKFLVLLFCYWGVGGGELGCHIELFTHNKQTFFIY